MYVFSCHNIYDVYCVCACVSYCAHARVLYVCVCVRGYVLVCDLYVCMCVCVCVHVCVCMCVCVYFNVLVHIYGVTQAILFLFLVTIDMTRVLTAVLLQETQPQDSHGEPTITSLYTSWSVLVIKVMAP